MNKIYLISNVQNRNHSDTLKFFLKEYNARCRLLKSPSKMKAAPAATYQKESNLPEKILKQKKKKRAFQNSTIS